MANRYIPVTPEEAEEEKKGGNIGLPFGLCAKYGIRLPGNATPRIAWDALKDKTGMTPEDFYRDLRQKESKGENEVKNAENSPGNDSTIEYREFKTIAEAKNFAQEQFGIYAEYEKMDINIVNAINRNLTSIYNEFGKLNELGSLEGIRYYPKKARWCACYVPSYGSVYLKNVRDKNAYGNLKRQATIQKGFGFWSTDSAEHAIRHELGHAIENAFIKKNPVKAKKIEELRAGMQKTLNISRVDLEDSVDNLKKAGAILSYYALRNVGAFVAESFAEYLNGNPRPMAQKVIDILKED